MLLLAWTLIKKFWPEVTIGVGVLILAGWIESIRVERDHYKGEVVKLQADLQAQQAETSREAAAFQAQTETYRASLAASFSTIEAQQKSIQGKINENKQLRTIVIPDLSRQLYNLAASHRSDQAATTAAAGQADDGTPGTCNLADLQTVDNINLAKLERNAEKLEKWQKFWQDYKTNLNGPTATP